MQARSPNEDVDAFMTKWEEGLQALFQSLSKECEKNLQAKNHEDLEAFMAKWVDGARNLLQSLPEEMPESLKNPIAIDSIMAGEKQRQEDLPSQEKYISSFEESLSRQDTSKNPEKLNSLTTISPLEVETVMRMVEKLHRDAQRSETESTAPLLSLLLEVKGDKGAGSLMIPVSLKNLCQGMVVLEVNNLGFITNPQTLQGNEAVLRVTDPESQESMNIRGALTWTQSTVDKKINLNLRMQSAPPNMAASKILEDSLPAASKDTKMLWNLWNQMQEIGKSVPTDQKFNFILLLLACGTVASSFMEPRLFQSMQYLLSALGLGKILHVTRER